MIGELTEQTIDERKRYTTRLQRRVQAHITAELGHETNEDGGDRQVVMLIQHALETTRARRVTLYRPIARGHRWHVLTALDDGSFHYGLVPPDSLGLPMAAYVQKRAVVFGPAHPLTVAPPTPSVMPGDLGIRSYLGLPLQTRNDILGVLEVVDVAKPEALDQHVTTLEPALVQLVEALSDEARVEEPGGWADRPPNSTSALDLAVVCDLVLRPAGDPDDTFTISPDEWKLLLQFDGERPLADAGAGAGLAPAVTASLAASLLARGLIRLGKEARRRG